MDPKEAMEQAIKSLNNYRVTLRDQWNFHGLTSSEHYGLDGLPWATSHYTFHLVLWHLPLALSGQQYFAPNGTLKFSPKYNVPYWLPFYLPQCMGNIEAKEEKTGKSIEVLYKLRVSLGLTNTLFLIKHTNSLFLINRNSASGKVLSYSEPDIYKKVLHT